jgi:hypothetical protein
MFIVDDNFLLRIAHELSNSRQEMGRAEEDRAMNINLESGIVL